MKEIYELNFKLADGHWINLLYSSEADAHEDLAMLFTIGRYYGSSKIISSFVMPRTLF